MSAIHKSHRSFAQEHRRYVVMLVTICILIAMVVGLWNVASLFTNYSRLHHKYNIK